MQTLFRVLAEEGSKTFIKKFAGELEIVILRELSEQTGKWMITKAQKYVSETIAHGKRVYDDKK